MVHAKAAQKEKPEPIAEVTRPYVPVTSPLPPLPECEGPKLCAFAQNFEDLKFEPELVIYEPDQNAHSLVIKARLDGELYAIKFVSQAALSLTVSRSPTNIPVCS